MLRALFAFGIRTIATFLSGLTADVGRLPAVAQVPLDGTAVQIRGLLRAARPAFLAALQARATRTMLVVVPAPQAAAELAQELALWSSQDVLLYPALETLPYERVQLDRSVLAQRQSVVRAAAGTDPVCIVAPVRALLQPIPTAREHVETIVIKVGERVLIDSLLQQWTEAGYVAEPLVEEQGSFARRGGVLDIFPAGASRPVRLELFGHDIESIREFDVESQRSLDRIDSIEILPVAAIAQTTREQALEALLLLDTSDLTAEAQTTWMDDLARLEAGAPFEELGVFAPYLLDRATSLADTIPAGSLVVADDPDACLAAMKDLTRQAQEIQHDREASGELPHGLKAALLDETQVLDRLRSFGIIQLRTGSDGDGVSLDAAGIFVPASNFTGRVTSMPAEIKARQSERFVLVTQQCERVGELLADEGITAHRVRILTGRPPEGVTLLPISLSTGWRAPDMRITLLTDHELFGTIKHRTPPRPKRAARDSFFADFAPGDYVVHLEHGIGRFDSVIRMSIEGIEREYALIQYAGADRVYVPSDQLERLTRYIGVGDTPPPLNRLGGNEWQRARSRAKKAAEDIAADLIDIYSKRMARPGYAFAGDTPWQHELESSFAYVETPDQSKAIEDVKYDMEQARPMDRLVCADVGYGKTEVAVRAAFKAVLDGKQVAVLVPTTILAQQHFETFSDRFAAFPIKVEVISRFRTAAQQKEILRKLAAGEVDVVIGTHRLLSKDVQFANLGLLIIDEEQRFGVKHKEQLKRLRETIDVLTLTATPIPRTLHMGLVGIREISVIETPPEGRLPIKTYLQPFEERLIHEALLRELDRGGQVYVVHNKVSSIEALAERIRRLVPQARVLVGHGQMDESQLEKVMLSFAHHEADVLVASTIIENGLDIPNVNTIIVNHAESLGLTQLYQLRGRVGRSANQAYAYLLYPRDARLSQDAVRRMEAVFEAQDLGSGFNIAMKDLEIRGVGNLLGSQQSGNAAAVGFDLFSRMISDEVERHRGKPVQEQQLVTVDLPLTMFLPAGYVGNESERLILYRRLAAVTNAEQLDALEAEIIDRFGPVPVEVENLLTSVRVKLLASAARVSMVSLSAEALVLRTLPDGLYDRVSLYRKYGDLAKISTNVLRIARRPLGDAWLEAIFDILGDMVRLRESIARPQPVNA